MFQPRWPTFFSLFLLVTSLAAAEPVALRLEPRALHEGRPSELPLFVEAHPLEERAVLPRSLRLYLDLLRDCDLQPLGATIRS